MPLKVVPRRDRKLHRLVKRGETRVLKRGEPLCMPGDPAVEVFLVRTGHISLSVREADGGLRRVGIVGPWELAGEEGLRDGASRLYGAAAGEATQVTLMDGPGARRALQTTDKTFQAFLAAKEADVAFGRALRGLRKPGGTRKRLGLFLLHLAHRFGRSEEKGTRLPIRLTHQLLADLTVIHRSTVTTILNDWIYRGVVREDMGHIILVDADELE